MNMEKLREKRLDVSPVFKNKLKFSMQENITGKEDMS